MQRAKQVVRQYGEKQDAEQGPTVAYTVHRKGGLCRVNGGVRLSLLCTFF